MLRTTFSLRTIDKRSKKRLSVFFLKPPCGLPPIGKTIHWDLCFYMMVIWRRFLSMLQLADVASESS
ncbi:hypothetical protein IY40_10095 [Serratia marcescens]|nr:hypothetical protein IY40_10095 [Serratia marcescens]